MIPFLPYSGTVSRHALQSPRFLAHFPARRPVSAKIYARGRGPCIRGCKRSVRALRAVLQAHFSRGFGPVCLDSPGFAGLSGQSDASRTIFSQRHMKISHEPCAPDFAPRRSRDTPASATRTPSNPRSPGPMLAAAPLEPPLPPRGGQHWSGERGLEASAPEGLGPGRGSTLVGGAGVGSVGPRGFRARKVQVALKSPGVAGTVASRGNHAGGRGCPGWRKLWRSPGEIVLPHVPNPKWLTVHTILSHALDD